MCVTAQRRGLTPRVFEHLFSRIAELQGIQVLTLIVWTHGPHHCSLISSDAQLCSLVYIQPMTLAALLISCSLPSPIALPGMSEQDGQRQVTCKCSFLEIYNETITDLLGGCQTNLHIREDAAHGVYVEGLHEESVATGPGWLCLLPSLVCRFLMYRV